MKSEWRIFGGVALFLALCAPVYGWWTNHSLGHVDWVGTTALIMSTLLCAMCGGYFWFVSRRIDLRPEDRDDAEIAEGAGEIGFFSPGSYWPFGIAAFATTAMSSPSSCPKPMPRTNSEPRTYQRLVSAP
ncbi:cytochrome c oxidase subunit 4, partial [Hamadaea sp. NPDC051192]|uniref:cytochrome c oxidase subunit 4 n=1 Tax=Hamadaea sp. NPDC051192 TaxID=3154940 RepID=UPI0034198574